MESAKCVLRPKIVASTGSLSLPRPCGLDTELQVIGTSAGEKLRARKKSTVVKNTDSNKVFTIEYHSDSITSSKCSTGLDQLPGGRTTSPISWDTIVLLDGLVIFGYSECVLCLDESLDQVS